MLREEKDEKKLKEIMGKKKVERVGGWRESKLLPTFSHSFTPTKIALIDMCDACIAAHDCDKVET